MNNSTKPKCTWHDDCFAIKDGKCNILTSTDFKRDCPFYKTAEEVQRTMKPAKR